ncbi:hypothetical protein A3A39_01875 [Candidatus Kaiserbacteria bacterium RIFCSPLOWO2_01_FULL_54_13]|uniref:Uncharacterized protein n=1 Tax=Candidatus Kaiserbacteria bacterium RIFCSPLOWO2_01_FULL_54_13 TaxID=1798512 RepID=A0A1F6F089_9BACT|nr:MAG: hypothetical protein A3A39_01875 [Candidatus Kaiserbacteria bacterium RIFCSPLOWO2_01_FULL_54_13]
MADPERPQEREHVGGRSGFIKETEAEALKLVQSRANEYEFRSPENVVWIRDVLKKIDFQELHNIYREVARRAGVRDINFVLPHHIYPRGTDELGDAADADYDPISNAISLDGDLVARVRMIESNGEKLAVSLILQQIAHEYAHATGYVAHGEIELDQGERISAVRMGLNQTLYNHTEDRGTDYYTMFELFNEGATEHIATLVSREYLRRLPLDTPSGGTLKLLEFDEFLKIVDRDKDDYGAAVEFFNRLSAHISKECEVSQEIVQGAFIRAYYRGEALPAGLLDETVGKEFTKMLMRAKDAKYLKKLTRDYSLLSLSPSLRERWARFIESVRRAVR